jgi:epoxyqueuosine reductase QueG
VRLATVITELPMALDAAVDIGVEDLCATCRRCTLDCPPTAITDKKQWVRGDHKWYVDFDKCVPYFSIAGGCAICIQVCPWAEDGRGPVLSGQLLKKRAAKAAKRAPAPAAE